MRVDIPHTASEQGVTVNETEDLGVRGDNGGRQVREVGQHGFALAEVPQSQFADDKGVTQSHSGVEERGQVDTRSDWRPPGITSPLPVEWRASFDAP